jgi:PadR family transcriptional regulator PadR
MRRARALSGPAIRILGLMLQDPSADYYGLDLSQRAGLLTGTVYPLLQRLEERGWMESHREDVDPGAAGRPARRLYRLTGLGEREGRRELTELQAAWRPALRPETT